MTQVHLQHQRWAVLGLGKSGIAAANALARLGKTVYASDSRPYNELQAAISKLHPGVTVFAGGNHLGASEIVVTSPGLRPSLPIFHASDLPVISDIELAYLLSPAPFVAITGTDGKTTTTSLVGEIMAQTNTPYVVAGNIGVPLCDVVQDLPKEGVVVAEVSAFQLWSTHTFRPVTAALTNLAGDHLDYFEGSWTAYVGAKKKMIASMEPGDLLWLPAHDDEAMMWQKEFPGQVGLFGNTKASVKGAPFALWQEGRGLFAREFDKPLGCWCDDVTSLGLQGPHNVRNMLAAAGIARGLGVSFEAIVQGLRAFNGLPHRFETIATHEGVRFINDSKATNAHAALTGLSGLQDPYVAIVGGVDKGLELGEFCQELKAHARAVVVIGDLRARLVQELQEHGMPAAMIKKADSMADAVESAFGSAIETGTHTLVLSPAASSFDMFKSYEHRGEVFVQVVHELVGKQG